MNDRYDKIVPGVQHKLHLAVDISLAALAVVICTQLPAEHYMTRALSLSAVAAMAWLILAGLIRLYSPVTPRSIPDNLTLRLMASMLTALALKLFVASSLVGATGEGTHLDGWRFGLLFFATGSVGRLLIFKPLSRFAKPAQDVLIVGSGHLGLSTYESLTLAPMDQRSDVVGFLSLENQPTDLGPEVPAVLGNSERLLEVLSNQPVSEVYVAGRVTEHGYEMQEVVSTCERVGMPFALPLHSLHFERAHLLSSVVARDGYLHYMQSIYKPLQVGCKRLFDIAASAVALAVLSPLLIGVALVIKFSSSGPVLFKQRRVGLHGAGFDLLKFRSMVVNAEELKAKLMAQNEQTGPVFKMQSDPRITPIGRFIRKYSIDELPQLINILRGDMATVGPRPAVLSEDACRCAPGSPAIGRSAAAIPSALKTGCAWICATSTIGPSPSICSSSCKPFLRCWLVEAPASERPTGSRSARVPRRGRGGQRPEAWAVGDGNHFGCPGGAPVRAALPGSGAVRSAQLRRCFCSHFF
jgi:lipopolysaccharide/colanic/teichoic acid biosynthesis glycosyltransferase